MKKIIFLVFFLVNSLLASELELSFLDFPPYFSSDKNGKAVGYIIDYVRDITSEMNVTMKAKELPMKRIVSEVKRGKSQSTVLLQNVFKQNEVYRSKKPILTIHLRSYYIGDKAPIKKKEDLSGKKIGIFRGFTYWGWINYIKDPKNNVKYFEVTSHVQLLKLLKMGRVDYALDYKAPIGEALKKFPFPELKYESNFKAPVWFFLSKEYSKDKFDKVEFMKRFDKVHAKLAKERTFPWD